MKLPFSLFFYFLGVGAGSRRRGHLRSKRKREPPTSKTLQLVPQSFKSDEFTVVRELDLNYLSAQLFGGRQSKWMKPNLRILDVGGVQEMEHLCSLGSLKRSVRITLFSS